MIQKYAQGNRIAYEMSKWLVDTKDEISQIPKQIFGSTVYVITTGENWMMSSDGKWYPITDPSKDPVECQNPESTIWGDLPTV